MKNKFLAVALCVALVLSSFMSVGVFAEQSGTDYSDYVAPGERDDNLIADNTNLNLYRQVNTTVVKIEPGETSAEVEFIYVGDGNGNGKWGNFSFYGTEGTWAKSTDNNAGGKYGFNGYYPAGPESFVVEMQLKNAAPTINPNPEFTVSVFTDRAEGVAEKQIIPVTQTDDWQTVSTIFHTDKETPTSMWIALGYGGKSSKEFPAIGTIISLYKPSLYVAVERAQDITVTGTQKVLPGQSAEFEAQVVNQIGTTGNLSQDFSWTALSSDRSEVVDGFEFTKGADGAVTVDVAPTVPAGKYVILASHNSDDSVERGVRKGAELIVIPHYMEDSAPGTDPLYEVKLTTNDDTKMGIFDTITIDAALVDSNGEKGTNEQKFDWYVLTEDRTEKVIDAGIELAISDDTASAGVSLEPGVAEGNYYIVAESVAAESAGMLRAMAITVDKSDTITDIIKSIKNDTADEVLANIDAYIVLSEADADYLEKADKEELCAILSSGASEEELEDIEDLCAYIEKAALTALYNIPSDSVELFDDEGKHNYESVLGVDKIDDDKKGTTLYSAAFAEMSENGKAAYQASLTGKDFETCGDLYDAIVESLLLTSIANPRDEGTAYLDSIITKENLALAGITADKYFDLSDDGAKAFKKDYLVAQSFTLEKLQSTLDKATEPETDDEDYEDETPKKPTGGKVSFGGGGGGSSSNKDDKKEETLPTKPVEFTDVPATHWACGDIHYLKSIGVINGVTETTYEPEATVTREQFLKLIMEAFKIGTSGESSAFDDVDSGAWYAPYVTGAVANGIINGKSETSFGVGDAVTRQDACVMIDRALALSSRMTESVSFGDKEDISDYAVSAVGALAGYGIVNGVGNNQFAPKGICTRAQAAKIIAGAISICNSLGIRR